MIVPAKINYIKAIRITGIKFIYIFLLTFLIDQLIQANNWQDKLIPDRFIVLISSAVGIFLGFRINAAYTRWRDGHGIFRDLVATALSIMLQINMSTKSKPQQGDALYQFKLKLAVHLMQYVHLVRLKLLEGDLNDWHSTLKALTFNEKPLFSEQLISKLALKKRKDSYVLKLISELIHEKNSNNTLDTFNFNGISEIAKSIQLLYLDAQTMMSLKYTPFPWGYQFYTRMFVWILPVLFVFSTLNDSNIVDNLMMSLLATIFITTEQVARNLDNPITNSFNCVPFNATARVLEIELLEYLDIAHHLNYVQPEDGVLR